MKLHDYARHLRTRGAERSRHQQNAGLSQSRASGLFLISIPGSSRRVLPDFAASIAAEEWRTKASGGSATRHARKGPRWRVRISSAGERNHSP